ncbi:MAG: ABC transporter permease [Saprospiraceae bacterium]|nr:ABC transporter permease [Saprospiraceae bacterium]MBK7796374.1 ABC transporter permease [Saprospiraceae bacterium]MBK9379010.1 ABC transporter permease [Saprospiraceae bacterium]MBL0260239.1 ABC transporter permease [Saprospiraceae bacterium]
MNQLEIFRIALSNIRANLLRSAITLTIIALGVMALVGILTAIDGIIFSMSSNFSYLGANSFNIQRLNSDMRSHQGGRKSQESEQIDYFQATSFKEKFTEQGLVSLSVGCTNNATIKFGSEKTNPTVRVRAIDDNYFKVAGYEIEYGRSFSPQEQESGSAKAIIGMELVKKLFKDKPEYALLKSISVNDQKYQVVGVLKSKGASMNEGADRRILIPLVNGRVMYGDLDYDISVKVDDAVRMEAVISSATGVMRIVRGLKSFEENDFEIRKSDGIIEFLKENTTKLRAAAIAIGLMTLLGAAIGLMNIMLVSVTERTKEIGIIKALGATRRNILIQFLIEAVLICLIGGVLGVALAIPLGNIVTVLMGGPYIIPWAWIILGFAVCTIVGIVAGLYPAVKASALDPVESLRYE